MSGLKTCQHATSKAESTHELGKNLESSFASRNFQNRQAGYNELNGELSLCTSRALFLSQSQLSVAWSWALFAHPGAERLALALALVHGVFAATGLVLLGAQVINGSEGLPRVAHIIFLVAALGGFYLFSLHLRKRALPLSIIAI